MLHRRGLLELPTLNDYIAAEANRKRQFTVDDVAGRAGRAIELLVANGVTHIRTQVDVDTSSELRGLEGIQAAAARYRDVVDVQIVAFPQQGIVQDPGSEELLREAMRRGADAIGGHPQLEICDHDSQRHIATVFDIAEEFDADVDMHVDETTIPTPPSYMTSRSRRSAAGGRGGSRAAMCARSPSTTPTTPTR